MQQPIIEFTNYYEFERVLREMTEMSQKQATIIQQQAEEIQKMKDAIEQNEKKSDRICHVVGDLVLGLFNDEKQPELILHYTDILSGNKDKPSGHDLQFDFESGLWGIGYWGKTPTTRQGDNNDKRIKSLERILYKISNVFHEDSEEGY